MPYIRDEKGNKFLLGIHRATVVDRDDKPSVSGTPHRGRIKVEIPYIRQESDQPWPFWCDYCGPSHQFFSVPAVGTKVIVAFNGGNPEQPVWLGAVNTTKTSKDPPSRFRRDEPDVSGYESLQGHFIEFNDISGERRIRIEDLNGNFMEWDTELDDLNVLFQHDENREIQNDRFTDIGNDDQLDIVNDNRIDIGNDQTRDIGNNQTLTVGVDQKETIGNDQTLIVGNDQTETIGNIRDITVVLDDKLQVTNNKTQDIQGTWDDTIEGAYSRTGQDTGTWDFQGEIAVTTQDNMVYTVGGDWTTETTGNWENTVTGDWTGEVTGSIEFEATQDVTIEATLQAQIKNTIFEVTMTPAIMTIGSLTSNIIITPASVTITVGGTTQTWTAAGSTFVGSTYILSGIDHITHKHFNLGLFAPTSPPTGC